jgi:hypothetical protein
VQRFTPELIDAARPGRHVAGDRWFVDETYLNVAGAVDVPGPLICLSSGAGSTRRPRWDYQLVASLAEPNLPTTVWVLATVQR